MPVRRRHRLIWSAVALIHVVALGAIWVGGRQGESEPTREGGVILITLVPEPIALPGEAPSGRAVGAGQPAAPIPPQVVVAEAAVVVVAKPLTPATASLSAEFGAAVSGSPTSVVVAPTRDIFIAPAFAVRTEPTYPARARRAGVEGQVMVKVRLAASGSVQQVELVSGSGSRLLDEAALAAAQASSFTPAQRNGLAVEAEAVATYRFELR